MDTTPPVTPEEKLDRAVQAAFGSAARIEKVIDLAGDASTRRYQRVLLRGGQAPATTVVMWLADRGVAMSSDELAVFPEPPRELPFVNVHRFLARIGIDVPAIYLDRSDEGLLLLEDVGDAALRDVVERATPDRVRTLYRAAIEQLVTLQLEGIRQADPSCIAFGQQFDARLYLWEFEHFLEYGVEGRLGRALKPAVRALLQEHFQAIAERLDAEPKFLAHRDYHSWNLFVQAGDRICVLDFQDALLATPAYDLATLLGDRDTPTKVTPDLEEALLEDFLAAWQRQGGPPLDPTRFRETYLLCALQKALKVVGRFYFLAVKKNKPHYLRYIPDTTRQVLRLLPRFADHRPMATVLRELLPE